jgi:hypothetical protein
MGRKASRIALAVLIGCAIAAVPSVLQSHVKAGSIPDLLCELISVPGKLIAAPFHDRGTASPEFLWRSRIATAVVFSGLAYWLLRSSPT